jgi:aspartyl-tRNA(Asn)/glutamyl-tRNA(Gln) amidotransferase subunit C
MDINEVHRIAKLSRLQLSASEALAVLPQLEAVFALVEQMQAVNTDQIEPLSHPILFIEDLSQPLRVDACTESNAREENMANAPAQAEGYFLVPRVIE